MMCGNVFDMAADKIVQRIRQPGDDLEMLHAAALAWLREQVTNV